MTRRTALSSDPASSARQAARVEVAQTVETQKREEHPIEDRVVEQLIRKTDVEPAQGHADRAGAITPTTSGDNELRRCIDDLAIRLADLQNHLLESNPT